jgi:transposase
MGRQLLLELGPLPVEVPLVMDRAYESDETRQLVLELNMIPVVPPKSNRREPWDYDRDLYKKRNQLERLFRRLKGFRRIFSRFEKLDVVFLAFIYFAFIIEALQSCEQALASPARSKWSENEPILLKTGPFLNPITCRISICCRHNRPTWDGGMQGLGQMKQKRLLSRVKNDPRSGGRSRSLCVRRCCPV